MALSLTQFVSSTTALDERHHATETAVAPAIAGQPTVAEIQTYANANAILNTLVYYTGNDVATDPVLNAYDVDNSGNATQLEASGGSGNYATADLTADAARTHTFADNNLIENFSTGLHERYAENGADYTSMGADATSVTVGAGNATDTSNVIATATAVVIGADDGIDVAEVVVEKDNIRLNNQQGDYRLGTAGAAATPADVVAETVKNVVRDEATGKLLLATSVSGPTQINETGAAFTIDDASTGNTIRSTNNGDATATVNVITTLTGYVRIVNDNGNQRLTITSGTATLNQEVVLETGETGLITYHNNNEASVGKITANPDSITESLAAEQIINVAALNQFYPIDTTTGPRSVAPAGTPATWIRGQSFAVADSKNNAGTNNITVDFTGAHLFNGASVTHTIDADGGMARYVFVDAAIGFIRDSAVTGAATGDFVKEVHSAVDPLITDSEEPGTIWVNDTSGAGFISTIDIPATGDSIDTTTGTPGSGINIEAQERWQSFTTGAGGDITAIAANITISASGSTITARIRDGVGDTGTLIGTATFTSTGPVTNATPSVFTPVGTITLAAATQYSLTLQRTSGSAGSSWQAANADILPGETSEILGAMDHMFSLGTAPPGAGTTWLPLASLQAAAAGAGEDLSYFYSTTVTGSLNTTTPSLVVAGTDVGTGITNNGDGSFTINTAGRYELDANFSSNGSPAGNLNAFWADGIGGPQVGSRASAAHDSPSANTTTGGGNAHAIVDATAGQVFWIDSVSNVTFGGVYITIKQLPTSTAVVPDTLEVTDLHRFTLAKTTGQATVPTAYPAQERLTWQVAPVDTAGGEGLHQYVVQPGGDGTWKFKVAAETDAAGTMDGNSTIQITVNGTEVSRSGFATAGDNVGGGASNDINYGQTDVEVDVVAGDIIEAHVSMLQGIGITATQTTTYFQGRQVSTKSVLNTTDTPVIDDDTMGTALSTNVASAESVKAYVDANAGGAPLSSADQTLTASRFVNGGGTNKITFQNVNGFEVGSAGPVQLGSVLGQYDFGDGAGANLPAVNSTHGNLWPFIDPTTGRLGLSANNVSRSLSGIADPTNGTTVAYHIGQLYINRTTGNVFHATTASTAADISGAGSVWAAIAGGAAGGGSILDANGSQTGPRNHDFGAQGQTWNNMGNWNVFNDTSKTYTLTSQNAAGTLDGTFSLTNAVAEASVTGLATGSLSKVSINSNGSEISFVEGNTGSESKFLCQEGTVTNDTQCHIHTEGIENSTVTTGQVLTLLDDNTGECEWAAAGGAFVIDDATDVDTTTTAPANGDVLEWDGTNWVPKAPGAGGTTSNGLMRFQGDVDDISSDIGFHASIGGALTMSTAFATSTRVNMGTGNSEFTDVNGISIGANNFVIAFAARYDIRVELLFDTSDTGWQGIQLVHNGDPVGRGHGYADGSGNSQGESLIWQGDVDVNDTFDVRIDDENGGNTISISMCAITVTPV